MSLPRPRTAARSPRPRLSSTEPKPVALAVARYCARRTGGKRRFNPGTYEAVGPQNSTRRSGRRFARARVGGSMIGTAAHSIGRVGALAVALGVGIALANTPVVALAEPADSSASSPEASSSSSPHASGATPHTSATSSSTSTDLGSHRGPLNAPVQMTLSSVGRPTSSPTASDPGGAAHAGEVGRTRSNASVVVVATGDSHTNSSTVSSASSTALASIAAKPEPPSTGTPHIGGTASSLRSSTTTAIGPDGRTPSRRRSAPRLRRPRSPQLQRPRPPPTPRHRRTVLTPHGRSLTLGGHRAQRFRRICRPPPAPPPQ